MASTFYLNRDGSQPAAVKADESKVKVFDNIDSIDTSTLEEGEIVATRDDSNSQGQNIWDYVDSKVKEWNTLSDFENFEIAYYDYSNTTISGYTPTTVTTIPYDGVVNINARFASNNGIMGVYINGEYRTFINKYGGGFGSPEYESVTVDVNKGDQIALVFNSRYTSQTPYTKWGCPLIYARWYKNR